MSERVTRAEFARRQGCSRSYVTKLGHTGRLVESEGLIDIDATLVKISETADPAHAAQPSDADERSDAGDVSYSAAKARKEFYQSLSAKLDYERAAGEVAETASIVAAGREIGTVVRTQLERIADRLAPALAAETDAPVVHAMLVGEIESVLLTLANQIAGLSERWNA